ncbi:hypothetical protein [Paraburkholderia diazotrophica]|uniref:hypothetical protein n=1 Tax=Paraburkholderia diazotrophica TaxID=667676 RepID=UPI000B85062F|nr:hypothetical protein [Paraburkholderia diazotrophica]
MRRARTISDDAPRRYIDVFTPTIILASRSTTPDQAATQLTKGTRLLGVQTVIAHSFERTHRSNLACLGVLLPLSATTARNGPDSMAASFGFNRLIRFVASERIQRSKTPPHDKLSARHTTTISSSSTNS